MVIVMVGTMDGNATTGIAKDTIIVMHINICGCIFSCSISLTGSLALLVWLCVCMAILFILLLHALQQKVLVIV